MSPPNNIPPYTPMPSLGHELGVMSGFILACLLIMAVYIYFWRGMANGNPPLPTFHSPRVTPEVEAKGIWLMSSINEAADRRDKQRDKDRQRELAQRGFRYERLRGLGGSAGEGAGEGGCAAGRDRGGGGAVFAWWARS